MKYSKTMTVKSGNCTDRVHFPDLTQEEHDRREAEFRKSAERFARHMYEVEQERETKNQNEQVSM